MLGEKDYSCGGILSLKEEDEIFVEDISTGKSVELASARKTYNGPSTPKYSFNPYGIDFGVQALEKGASCEVFVVDELGYLELRNEGFFRAVALINERKGGANIAVIRTDLVPSFLAFFDAPLVFETDEGNRDTLPDEIGAVLLKRLDRTGGGRQSNG